MPRAQPREQGAAKARVSKEIKINIVRAAVNTERQRAETQSGKKRCAFSIALDILHQPHDANPLTARFPPFSPRAVRVAAARHYEAKPTRLNEPTEFIQRPPLSVGR